MGRRTEWFIPADLDLAVRPPWDLDDHIHDLVVVVIGVCGDIVPVRDGLPVAQEPDPPILRAPSEKFSMQRTRLG